MNSSRVAGKRVEGLMESIASNLGWYCVDWTSYVSDFAVGDVETWLARENFLLQKTILVIGGDEWQRDAMSSLIEQNGEFASASVPDLQSARQLLSERPVDLTLLDLDACDQEPDWEAPGIFPNGMLNIPVLMLTSKPVGADQDLASDSTAQRFLEKPVSIRDLYARMHSLLQSHERAGHASFTVGKYSVDPFKMVAACPEGTQVPLTEKEFKMLRCLHRAGGSIVSKDELKRQVFGYSSEIDTHTAATHVNKLRNKLERNPKRPQFILTERGGYRLAS